MLKRIGTVFDGPDEAILRTRKQDEEFCRRLRAAIERGHEFCPISAGTGTKKPPANAPVNTAVNTEPVNEPDHKAYIRQYMRQRRAKARQTA
jgi:hypothetical protein